MPKKSDRRKHGSHHSRLSVGSLEPHLEPLNYTTNCSALKRT